MTVHVVSVGVSLKNFFERGYLERRKETTHESTTTRENIPGGSEAKRRWKEDKLGFDKRIYNVDDKLIDAFGLESGITNTRALDFFREITVDVQAKNWHAKEGISAELDTIRIITSQGRTGTSQGIKENDLAFLLSSDTEEGLACAIWTAIALAEGDVERVLYLPEIDDHTRLVRPTQGQVIVLRINGLNAQRGNEFTDAMKELGYLARLLIGNTGQRIDPILEPEERVLFHLSGGYRATIPYLIEVAKWLRSLDCNTQAHILPERAEEALSIPLLRLDPRQVGLELTDFKKGQAPALPEKASLEGYAYEQVGKGAKLTAFGQGMKILFEQHLVSGR
ncbi:hypothetical protein SAMN02745673_03185 [Marinactinospora thermotolerans DSM 45154]|uniref:CRISPR-associated protein n=1 Tax=Marinactinospora thermotolerans DSM 45154 TaxID=1122192 RepID=A0A1T4S4V8_9ACTN|nr:hypothetical protein [Marinactinospora thermotolerans]SKA23177.1 hypothetical protein SAMN02745673_03185 [Marinactinospora thermotolerans DSM 45154]